MSFYDMATESKENQFKWFVKLNETQGPEAANKYVEILNQMPSVMTKPPMGINASTQNMDLMFDNLVNGPAPHLSSLLCKKEHLPNDAPPFISGNVSALPNRNSNDATSIASLNELINARQNNELGMHKTSIQKQAQQQSVPLYQRQAANNFNMQMAMITPTNDITDNTLFENLFNHNGGPNQSHISNDLHGNAQHFQGLPPLQSFVNPVKPLSNSVHMTQG